jgi:hypothetical protein
MNPFSSRLILLFPMVWMALGACSGPGQEAPANPPGTSAFVPKPTVPPPVELAPHKTVFPIQEPPWASGNMVPSGVVFLDQSPEVQWNNVLEGNQLTARGTFRITRPGFGQVRGDIHAKDAHGVGIYSKAAYLYVYSTEKEVFTGISEAVEPLDKARQAGQLSDETYREEKEKILAQVR